MRQGQFQNDPDEDNPLFQTDAFRIYCFKVLPCSKRFCHEWTTCPFSHPSEKAKRRDPRTCTYAALACPDLKKATSCPRGDSCTFSHNVFEYWLHPSRYRTQLCNEGMACSRKTCFFAHSPEQLRLVPRPPELGAKPPSPGQDVLSSAAFGFTEGDPQVPFARSLPLPVLRPNPLDRSGHSSSHTSPNQDAMLDLSLAHHASQQGRSFVDVNGTAVAGKGQPLQATPGPGHSHLASPYSSLPPSWAAASELQGCADGSWETSPDDLSRLLAQLQLSNAGSGQQAPQPSQAQPMSNLLLQNALFQQQQQKQVQEQQLQMLQMQMQMQKLGMVMGMGDLTRLGNASLLAANLHQVSSGSTMNSKNHPGSYSMLNSNFF